MAGIADPLTALSASRSLIERSIHWWATFLEIATAAVVLGVIIEVIATILEVRDEVAKGNAPKLHHIFTFIGSAIVILAVAAEFVAGSRSSSLETSLRSNNERAQALLSERTNEATADAVAIANKFGGLHSFVTSEVAEINGVMTDLQSESAQLMRARNEAMASAASVGKALGTVTKARADLDAAVTKISDLQGDIHDLTAPRAIDRLRVAAQLQEFAKTPFVMELASDSDAVSLAGQIGSALILAEWDWRPDRRSDNGLEFGTVLVGRPATRPMIAQGVLIEYANKDRNTLRVPATALADVLATVERLRNVHLVELSDQDMKNNADIYGVIHIIVGTRY